MSESGWVHVGWAVFMIALLFFLSFLSGSPVHVP